MHVSLKHLLLAASLCSIPTAVVGRSVPRNAVAARDEGCYDTDCSKTQGLAPKVYPRIDLPLVVPHDVSPEPAPHVSGGNDSPGDSNDPTPHVGQDPSDSPEPANAPSSDVPTYIGQDPPDTPPAATGPPSDVHPHIGQDPPDTPPPASPPKPGTLQPASPPKPATPPLPLEPHQIDLGLDEYKKRGGEALAEAEAAMKVPDISFPPWTKAYDEDPHSTFIADRALPGGLFKAMGLDPKATYTRITMRSKAEKPDEKNVARKHPIVNQCAYSKEQKTIIALSNWANNDFTPKKPKVAGRLGQSELTFQRWEEIAGSDVADLKYIIRQQIVNTGTKNTIKSLFEKLGFDVKKKGIFHPSTPGSDMDNAYRTLAGLDNARPNYRLYSQHHEKLHDIEVIKIHAWTDVSFESSCAMVFELGHK